MQFNHFSVMLDESIDSLNIKQEGIYVDCTLGGGGHSSKILDGLNNTGRLIGIDQDQYAIDYCRQKFSGYDNISFVQDNFKNIDLILKMIGIEKVDGILMDLGVSSYQIDTDDRGFSYIRNGKLDMRMDTSQSFSAYDIINGYDEEKLSYIFKVYGEEKYHRRIANKIVESRKLNKISTTHDLVKLIDEVIPKFEIKKRGHLSKKVFQALRIEVNGELEILEKAIIDAINHLNVGGRISIITFHSLEDRIVKNTFNYLATECVCPKDFPVCRCEKKKEISIINKKPVLPSGTELSKNSRSASAKLRVAEKLIY
ncbi:S-adenosyl-methyltransferase [Candidatus Arthromitus sp. SFB-mouse-Japan]|uniref:16S rRNA (cytosine(1402)-N(4))-methyltransferase RsmH n=1 Tax=Candidatus Arthromitus sp. SFB-mouse TaxID=49118 RepID=UPI00021B7EE4|nr:16S rRNA (cytosine(1402)-N(4))-methyltransferase RsmH [Candidatus Arthromitus sp. SFB-mouse]EIA27347.1 Ribosomal RNA small subunit methyltransferase H [Candidatus Arthromitus sp. SFB-co]EIA28418.1 Ribosomal RNA small subunit methyltransferase H [Candidatus Arthromitus sp. SFB-4]EIA30941.1 Ribosomal RNA small subunit methyltransferase H [Candidatus Arthromitus sp. SFB-mouse-SU]EGX28652.1 S-adenosyl-methyltransferase [Candidatus Arthromitus sp. SFB-mouse-NYU]BAK56668.1 S-adenosyl-methyltransf